MAAFAGEGAAGACEGAAGAGADSALGAAAAGSMAFTACLQAPDSFDMFFCKHCNEATPPGGTLAQFAS